MFVTAHLEILGVLHDVSLELDINTESLASILKDKPIAFGDIEGTADCIDSARDLVIRPCGLQVVLNSVEDLLQSFLCVFNTGDCASSGVGGIDQFTLHFLDGCKHVPVSLIDVECLPGSVHKIQMSNQGREVICHG